MRLADYVVSYSLEINNRCLRYLAECDARGSMLAAEQQVDAISAATHAVYAESLLARDSRRLTSMWALTAPTWKGRDAILSEHVRALRRAADALTDASSNRRLALRLAALAGEDEEAEAILKVARKLPNEVPLTWGDLNDLFAVDSHFWRRGLPTAEDAVLLDHAVRSYRKGYRLARELRELEAKKSAKAGVWLDGYGDKLHKWVQLSAHQMELLRGGLSEKAKAQLWYMDKMSDSLRTRAGLSALGRAARTVKVKKSAVKVVIGFIEQQIGKMDKRVLRLSKGCYTAKPKRMAVELERAVGKIGLPEVTLMDLSAGSGEIRNPGNAVSTPEVRVGK